MSGTDSELARARRQVHAAMAEATTAARVVGEHTRRVAGWLQHDDGSWSVVDARGKVTPVTAAGPDALAADVSAALAAVADPLVVDVEPLYTPELRQLLEVAERIARDRGDAKVDVPHVQAALRSSPPRDGHAALEPAPPGTTEHGKEVT